MHNAVCYINGSPAPAEMKIELDLEYLRALKVSHPEIKQAASATHATIIARPNEAVQIVWTCFADRDFIEAVSPTFLDYVESQPK